MVAFIQADRPSWNPSDEQLAIWSESLGGYEPSVLQKAARSFLEREKGPPNLARVLSYCRDQLALVAPRSEYEDSGDAEFFREEREDPEALRLTALVARLWPDVIPPGPDREAYLALCRRKHWVPYSGPGTLVGSSNRKGDPSVRRSKYGTEAQKRWVEANRAAPAPWAEEAAREALDWLEGNDRYGI